MEILGLIKKHAAHRIFKKKPIPKDLIKKIIEAGIWGPSIHHFQPWKFVVIQNKNFINSLSKIVIKKLENEKHVPSFIVLPTIKSISSPPLLIAVYNTGEFAAFINKFYYKETDIPAIMEVSAISAAIQNMMLVGESIGISSCWLGCSLICEKEINKFLRENNKLLALIAMGYPKDVCRRTERKALFLSVKYLDNSKKRI